MRAVVQRVNSASVHVEENEIASIGEGLLVLAGLHTDDTDSDLHYIISKVIGIRIFDDDNGIMNRSVADIDGEILLISQFTLYGDMRKGKRPSYTSAMNPEQALPFFETFVNLCKEKYPRVKSGIFGAHMKVSLENSGPVTILIDSTKAF